MSSLLIGGKSPCTRVVQRSTAQGYMVLFLNHIVYFTWSVLYCSFDSHVYPGYSL